MNKKSFIFVIVVFLFISFEKTLFAISDEQIIQKYDELSRTYFENDRKNGYIFFEGFDFNNYKPGKGGIQNMLDRTLDLLEKYYGNTNQPFVFVGHSQGGLRALAMSTYLKEKNPELYKQLKGVNIADYGSESLNYANSTVATWLGVEATL